MDPGEPPHQTPEQLGHRPLRTLGNSAVPLEKGRTGKHGDPEDPSGYQGLTGSEEESRVSVATDMGCQRILGYVVSCDALHVVYCETHMRA